MFFESFFLLLNQKFITHDWHDNSEMTKIVFDSLIVHELLWIGCVQSEDILVC